MIKFEVSQYLNCNRCLFYTQLDYCASLKNLDCLKGRKNYKFIQVIIFCMLMADLFATNYNFLSRYLPGSGVETLNCMIEHALESVR